MKQYRFWKICSLICSEFILVFLQIIFWFFLFSQKNEFEYIWILINETMPF
jgi:hypothetical protein